MKKILIFITLLIVGMCSCKANKESVVQENKLEITSASPLSEDAHSLTDSQKNEKVEKVHFSPSNEVLN